jgi:hypothetical protein
MKILLIAIPRSGSTTLMKTISSTLKLSKVNEPFNEGLWENVKYDNVPENNVIVKSLVDIDVPNIINFYKKYSKLFDKIILLSRKNTEELIESYAFQEWNRKYLNGKVINHGKWQQKYNYVQEGDLDNWTNWTNQMLKNKNDLEIISNELNIEIDWYEDLYCGDEEKIVNFLNKHKLNVDIPKFCNPLNPIHRLRQIKKTRI